MHRRVAWKIPSRSPKNHPSKSKRPVNARVILCWILAVTDFNETMKYSGNRIFRTTFSFDDVADIYWKTTKGCSLGILFIVSIGYVEIIENEYSSMFILRTTLEFNVVVVVFRIYPRDEMSPTFCQKKNATLAIFDSLIKIGCCGDQTKYYQRLLSARSADYQSENETGALLMRARDSFDSPWIGVRPRRRSINSDSGGGRDQQRPFPLLIIQKRPFDLIINNVTRRVSDLANASHWETGLQAADKCIAWARSTDFLDPTPVRFDDLRKITVGSLVKSSWRVIIGLTRK